MSQSDGFIWVEYKKANVCLPFPSGSSLDVIRSAFNFSGGYLQPEGKVLPNYLLMVTEGTPIVAPTQAIVPGKYELVIIGPGPCIHQVEGLESPKRERGRDRSSWYRLSPRSPKYGLLGVKLLIVLDHQMPILWTLESSHQTGYTSSPNTDHSAQTP